MVIRPAGVGGCWRHYVRVHCSRLTAVPLSLCLTLELTVYAGCPTSEPETVFLTKSNPGTGGSHFIQTIVLEHPESFVIVRLWPTG